MEELENENIEQIEQTEENTENNDNAETEENQHEEVRAYDYYDIYYNKMLDNTNTIIDKQAVIITNQENQINELKELNRYSYALVFAVLLIFIYNVLRNMIIVK